MTDDAAKSKVTLTVSFDVDQITNSLAYHFESSDHAHPNPTRGRYAGEVYFCEGEVFHLEVKGGGQIDRFSTFQIIDCCLITRPNVVLIGPDVKTRYAVPSPFLQVLGASYQFPLDFTSRREDNLEQNQREVIQRWKHTLDVGYNRGQWDLAFTLTVRIERGPLLDPDFRVFYFDPEGQVGPGNGE